MGQKWWTISLCPHLDNFSLKSYFFFIQILKESYLKLRLMHVLWDYFKICVNSLVNIEKFGNISKWILLPMFLLFNTLFSTKISLLISALCNLVIWVNVIIYFYKTSVKKKFEKDWFENWSINISVYIC